MKKPKVKTRFFVNFAEKKHSVGNNFFLNAIQKNFVNNKKGLYTDIEGNYGEFLKKTF